jgi:pheromone shutdown protein TraB
VEALKERETVRELMSVLQQELPEVYNAMIKERDQVTEVMMLVMMVVVLMKS